MRFLYKILIGLIIFNGVLVLFGSEFFPHTTYDEKAVDVVNTTEVSGFRTLDQYLFEDAWSTAGTVGLAIFGVSLVIGYLTRNLALFIGIGAFISILCSVWMVTIGTIDEFVGSYPVVKGLILIITIVIGILAVLTVVEILTEQRGVD